MQGASPTLLRRWTITPGASPSWGSSGVLSPQPRMPSYPSTSSMIEAFDAGNVGTGPTSGTALVTTSTVAAALEGERALDRLQGQRVEGDVVTVR